ncbi:MAG: ATP-binding protein [Polyangiales bacterium]
MYECDCAETHTPRRIVLTGGPGAGKTAVLELARQYFCKHVLVLPEAAGIVFGGGFPRTAAPVERAAAQRAIYRVQRELELIADHRQSIALVLCDRGTIDGSAYWPGPGTLWDSIDTTAAAELARYHAVIHLRTPAADAYNHRNPLRIESAAEAAKIDAHIAAAWSGHPRQHIISSTDDFFDKARAALALLRNEVPACCRPHVSLTSRV